MPLFDSTDSPTSTTPSRPADRPLDLDGVRPADLFDAWLFAEADATLALGAWRSADRAEKPDLYAGYSAALDREAHAARVLEHAVRRLR